MQYELLLGDHVHIQTFPVSISHFHLYIYQLLHLILPISTTKVNIKFPGTERIKQEHYSLYPELEIKDSNDKVKPSKNWHLCCLQLLWLIMSFPYQEVHKEEHPEIFDTASTLIFFVIQATNHCKIYLNYITLGGLIPTLTKSSGFIRGSSIDSLSSRI
jgi:hypothetical protein